MKMSFDETENTEPIIENEPIITESKPKPKIKPPSQTQQIKDLIKVKFEEGWQVTDKNSKLELQKKILDELKIKKGNSSDVGKHILEYMEKNHLKIPDKIGGKQKIGDTIVNLIKKEIPKDSEQIKSNIPNQSPSPMGGLPQSTIQKGALPRIGSTTQTQSTSRTEESEPEKKMNPDAQARLIKRGLNDIVAPIYIAMGIVEPDESEKKEEAKIPTAKKFRNDLDGLGDELNKYLQENNLQLPAFMNHIAIVISIFVVLVLPVVKFKFFSSKQDADPNFDNSVDDVEVKP